MATIDSLRTVVVSQRFCGDAHNDCIGVGDHLLVCSEQKLDRELQIRRQVTEVALAALQYLLRLSNESTRRQTHLALPELEKEVYRLDSVANYDATGDGAGATLLHVAAEDGNTELMSEVIRKEVGVDVSHQLNFN